MSMPEVMFIVSFAVIITLMIVLGRRDHVIRSTGDDQLIAELKRRAYLRKLKSDADAEVDALIRR